MSNYGQQPNPYGQNQPGQNPPGQQPSGQPQQPYGQRPGQQPYGQPSGQQPWGQPGQPQPGHQPQPGQPQPGQQPWGQPGQQPPYGQPQYPQPGQQQPGQQAGWIPQPASVARPALPARAVPVVSMDSVPGRQVAAVIGDVVGVVVRPRELAPELRAGNPLDGYAAMLTRSRQDAVTKMIDMAVAAGADAVVAFKYDCSEITQSLSEVSAYGTAVKLAPEPDMLGSTSSAEASAEAAPSTRSDSEQEQIRDEASSTTTLSRPASSSTPANQPQPGSGRGDSESDDPGSNDRPWPPSSWPSQN